MLDSVAMDYESGQRCQESGEYTVKIVVSHSTDREYSVLVVDANEPSDTICECEGFLFRGSCSHQQEAVDALCFWHELEGPEKQVGSQRRDKICPRCGGPTEWVTIYADV